MTEQHIGACDSNAPDATCAISTVAVTRWLKGGRGELTVQLAQPVVLYTTRSGAIGVGIADNDPAVQLNQDVVVFASGSDRFGRLLAIPYKIIQVVNNTAEPNPSDQLLAPVRGVRIDSLVADIFADVALVGSPVAKGG